MSQTGLVLDSVFCQHQTAHGHPERPERIQTIMSVFESRSLFRRCTRIQPQPCDPRWLRLNHDDDYIRRVELLCSSGHPNIDCADSSICKESYDVALLAAGSTIAACDAVMRGNLGNAFCAVRPPGHHAEVNESMGFCLFNNVAIAAHFLMAEYNIERVLILDWDVHHGNGTQHSFEDDPRVFFCSMHGHPSVVYPGTGWETEVGSGKGQGTTLNVAMMPGATDEDYRVAFESRFWPVASAYQPQFVLVSAGFDAHKRDPLAPIDLDTDSFAWLTRKTMELAQTHCDGRLVSVLEGGYDLDALANSAATHVESLLS